MFTAKKVVLTGTTSSGKSTFLSRLETDTQHKVYVVHEVARQLLAQFPGLEKDPSFQDILFDAQVTAECQAIESGARLVVCDRGALDIVAHARLFNQPVKSNWVEWSRSYDKILLFNKDDVNFVVTPLQQSLSDRDWHQFRDQLHQEIISSLVWMDLEYHSIQGTVEERLKQFGNLMDLSFSSPEGNHFRRKETR